MLWLLVLLFGLSSAGAAINLKASGQYGNEIPCIQKFSSAKLTCSITPLIRIVEWIVPSSNVHTQCSSIHDVCFPSSIGTYTFTSNVTSAEFYLDISNYSASDGGIFTCIHGTERSHLTLLLCIQVTNVYIQTLSRNLTEEDVLNVTQGEATTLTCITGTSRPDSTIIWYIGSNKQTKTGVPFVFYPRNSDNNRRVYCTAHNLQLEKSAVVSEKPKLYVKVRVKYVYITKNYRNLTTGEVLNVTQGESITLTCTTGTSRPAPTIKWYIGNTKQSIIGTNFEFAPQNAHNDKDVYCTAYNLQLEEDAAVSQKPKLYVKVQVSDVTIKAGSRALTTGEVVNVTHGELIILTCTTGTSRPASTISWYIGNTKQNTIDTFFEFSPQHADHNKNIYCTAYNLQLEVDAVVSQKPILFVKVKAARPSIVNGTTFFDGDSYFVQCKSSPTRPPANMAWMLGGKTLTNTTIRHETENYGLVHVISTVHLTASKPFHNAEITCQSWITGQVEKEDTSKTVTIFWRPVRPTVTAVNVFPWMEYREGELSCSSDDSGNPKSTITWVSNVNGVNKKHRFRIGPLSYLDNNRSVKCKLDNAFTTKYAETVISDEVRLDIQYTPKIFLKDTLFAARTKENITVTIPFLTNPNFTSVKLLVDELSFNSSNHDLTVEDYYMEIDFRGRKVNQMGYKLDFAIVDLQQNDFTTYMITFENEIGAANVSFSITSENAAKGEFSVGAAAGSGVGAAALIILAVIMFIVKRSNFTLTKGCKAASQQRADDLRLTEQPYDSLSPERNSASTYKKLTPLNHSDTQRSAASEYDDLVTETTDKHIYTGLQAEAKAKSSTEKVERQRQRMYENTRRMRPKDAVDKASEQNLGQKVAEPEAVYNNLMIRNA